MAGYSGTPLVKKLGIKPQHRVAILQPPADFDNTLGELPEGVVIESSTRKGDVFNVIVFFVDRAAELKAKFEALAQRLDPAGGLWISWPKKVSGVPTDLTEDIVRVVGLDAGLVDNKVCAVDDTWSGLRFVIRLQDRPKKKK